MFILGQRFLIGSFGHSFSKDASRQAHVNLSCLTEIKSCFVNLFTAVDTLRSDVIDRIILRRCITKAVTRYVCNPF